MKYSKMRLKSVKAISVVFVKENGVAALPGKWSSLVSKSIMARLIPSSWRNTMTKTFINKIARKIKQDGVVYTESYHSYYALDVSEINHHRINH
jgi:hypothetical protein